MVVYDPFESFTPGLTSSATSFFEIVPSDTDPLPKLPRAIRVGVPGDVMAVGDDGVAAPFRNCSAGEMLDIRAVKILKTGTTASNLVAHV